jgi:hypothetical protein
VVEPRKLAHLLVIAVLAAVLPAQDPETPPPAEPVAPAVQVPAMQVSGDAPNGTDFAETEGYRAVLAHALDHAPGLATDAAPELLDFDAFVAAPTEHQGRRVVVRGVLGQNWFPVRLRIAVRGVREVYRGVVTADARDEAGDFTDGVVFDAVAPLTDVEYGDHVEMEGIFYRTVTYEAKKGATRTAPYVIARSLHKIDSEAATEGGGFGTGSMLFLSVLLLAIAWFVFRLAHVARAARGRTPHPAASGFRAMFERRLATDRTKPKKL